MRKSITASWPTIVRLFFCRGPFAVFWRIRAIVILSLKQKAFWAFAHVGKELRKVTPALTNKYSAPAIAVKAFVFRICTALNHRSPDHILRGLSITGSAMRESAASSFFQFAQKATTTASIATLKSIYGDFLERSAIANTDPLNVLSWFITYCENMRIIGRFQLLFAHHYQKATESLTYQAFEWWHGNIIRQGMVRV
jgi:hypothetical protein